MFIYTKHANLRIKQRNLLLKQIEETLISPNKILSAFRGRQIAQKTFGRQVLEVVFKKEKDNIIILTAYWLEEENSR